MKERRGFIVWNEMFWLIMAILVIVLGLFTYFLVSGKLGEMINYFGDLLRFGK